MSAAAGTGRRPAAEAHAAIHLRHVSAGQINIVQQLPPAVGGDLRNLRLLASRVDLFWIEGVLRPAVPHATPFEVPRSLVPAAVEHPWAALEGCGRGAGERPATGPLIHTFDQCGRLLLVLGEPGSGKTISLLEIARDLNARFEADPAQPVAVVFNLAGWAARRLPLDEWLLEELAAKYFIPRKVARRWFERARLVVLLDGLDEVPDPHRAACVQAVREFPGSRSVAGLAVTCRTRDYAALPARLPLAGAVQIQALTDAHVAKFLDTSGRSTAALRLMLSESEELRELARTPLMLGLMLSVYGEGRVETSGPAATGGGWSAFLFDAYVERMIARKRAATASFRPERLRYCLTWLADRLECRGQSSFYLEQLQPGWLGARWQQLLYLVVSRVLMSISMTFVFLCACLFVFLLIVFMKPSSLEEFSVSPMAVLIVTCLGTLWLGGAAGLADGVLLLVRPDPVRPPKRRSWLRLLLYLATEAVHSSLGLPYGRPLLLLLTDLRGGGDIRENDVRPVEIFRFALRNALAGVMPAVRGWSRTVAVCFPFAVVALLCSDLQAGDPQMPGDAVLMAGGIVTLLIVFVLGGMLRRTLTTQYLELRVRPNSGIWSGLRNSVAAGGLMGLGLVTILSVVSAIAFAADLVFYPETSNFAKFVRVTSFYSFFTWLFVAPVAMCWFGAFDVVKHYTLRFFLWIFGYTPRGYVKFLDAAVDAGVLQRVGGGYRFLHHRLQAHLAARLPEYERAAAGAHDVKPAVQLRAAAT